MSFRTAAMAVFLIATVASIAGIPTRASYGARVTGDEPQYLLTAISLGSDGDLDISDEIAEGAYRDFHEVNLDRQTQPFDDGREVSPHDPLLSILLAAPMALGGWVGAKLFLAALHGLTAVMILAAAHRRLGLPLGPSTVLIGLFSASAPLAVYGNQVYPELPAALCVAIAIWALLETVDRKTTLIATACVVALPWLSVKYVPVAAVLAAFAIGRSVTLRRWTLAGASAGMLVVAAGVFAVGHLEWYGGLTPYAAGDHFVSSGEFGVMGTEMNLVGRSSRLMGLLIDRGFGLGAWQPLYLLVIPAAAVALARRDRADSMLVVVAAAGWLTAAFVALTMHGWWWPGRQTVVVLPAIVLLVARWVTDEDRLLRVAYGLGAAGVMTYLWFVIDGADGAPTWVVDPVTTSAPAYRLIGPLLPDYRVGGAGTWVLHGLWIVLLGLSALAVLRPMRRTLPSARRLD